GVLSWQYVSHKVLRWTLAPVSLFLLFILNAFIVWQDQAWHQPGFYSLFFWFQVLCYFLAAVGWYFENRKIRFKLLFIPYYFISINYAAIRGILRYFRGSQPAGWEKSKRA
ncbi:MAG: glycosyltransferase family 2 protein, partial [Bacteroidota bacterium]